MLLAIGHAVPGVPVLLHAGSIPLLLVLLWLVLLLMLLPVLAVLLLLLLLELAEVTLLEVSVVLKQTKIPHILQTFCNCFSR